MSNPSPQEGLRDQRGHEAPPGAVNDVHRNRRRNGFTYRAVAQLG